MVAGDSVFFVQRRQVVELALRNRLASIAPQREYVEAGGLMSYGESFKQFYRRAASFVDKIFKGAKPGDLPIEQPTRFEVVEQGGEGLVGGGHQPGLEVDEVAVMGVPVDADVRDAVVLPEDRRDRHTGFH